MTTQNVAPPPPVIPPNGGNPPNGVVATPVVAPVAVAPVAVQPVVQQVAAVPVVAAAVPVAAVSQPVVAQAVPVAVAPVPQSAVAQPVVAAPVAVAPPAVSSPVPQVQAPAVPQAQAPAPATPAASAPGPAPKPATAPKPAAPRGPKQTLVLAPRMGRKKVNWKALSTTILFSAGFHLLALLGCTFIVMSNPQLLEEIFTEVTENKEITDEPIVDQPLDQPNEIKESSDDQVATPSASEMVFDKGPADLNINDLPPAQLKPEEGTVAGLADFKFANDASGRTSPAAKAALVRTQGGNSASEAAVAYGMRWMAKHQFSDGGWSFEHDDHPDCKGQCTQKGALKGGCRTGATGFALLAFLGGGHTHQTGDYQKEVKAGVEFLMKYGKDTPNGFDLCPLVVSNEKMYVQGLCTIALSELSALTKDQRVKLAATNAVKFIVAGQNPKSGGWRYNPYPDTDTGDTSVVGWQIMALKSAKNAKLAFPGSTFKGAELYLNSAQVAGGSQYVYDLSQKAGTPTMTAAGLLCRMYLGWDRKNKGLQEGVKYLASIKPQPNNMYFNYYATQVMHHWGGDEWNTWNSVMRDQLIRTQKTSKDGHMQGSWDLADVHGAVGGRLYMSCLCVMTLEVYYRHLPIYRREGLKVEF